jgi:hypothetical protein
VLRNRRIRGHHPDRPRVWIYGRRPNAGRGAVGRELRHQSRLGRAQQPAQSAGVAHCDAGSDIEQPISRAPRRGKSAGSSIARRSMRHTTERSSPRHWASANPSAFPGSLRCSRHHIPSASPAAATSSLVFSTRRNSAGVHRISSAFACRGATSPCRTSPRWNSPTALSDLGGLASNYEAGKAQAYADFQSIQPVPDSGASALLGMTTLLLRCTRRTSELTR